jgi:hypothetical protein
MWILISAIPMLVAAALIAIVVWPRHRDERWLRHYGQRSRSLWRRVNDEPFEYAIRQGPHGDEFVKMPNGDCLRRPCA